MDGRRRVNIQSSSKLGNPNPVNNKSEAKAVNLILFFKFSRRFLVPIGFKIIMLFMHVEKRSELHCSKWDSVEEKALIGRVSAGPA